MRDQNIYQSPDGEKGKDGNVEGLEIVGQERPEKTYHVGGYIKDPWRADHEVYWSRLAYLDGPVISVSPESEIIEIVFTGGGITLIKKGGKWLVKKLTKEVAEEIVEEAVKSGAKILIKNTGDLLEATIKHGDDIIDVAFDINKKGDLLELTHGLMYVRGVADNSTAGKYGAEMTDKTLNQLKDYAKGHGFTKLRVQFRRMPNSSSKMGDHIFDRTFNLE